MISCGESFSEMTIEERWWYEFFFCDKAMRFSLCNQIYFIFLFLVLNGIKFCKNMKRFFL